MQILTSGSFINLDNQEKVEQLVFTAKAIADSAVQTDGFQSSEETNKRLALEIWQGAEYLTREHERARIQNIFTNNFLERLREIAPDSLPEDSVQLTEEISAMKATDSKDEFLGFVADETENDDQAITENSDGAAEQSEATNCMEVLSPTDETAASVQTQNLETEMPEANKSARAETEYVKPEIGDIPPNQETENKAVAVSRTEKTQKLAIPAITLSEKEPYRFDDCTVTATIQLLPTINEKRRAVLSVRTHDFAPQISVVELDGAAATPEQVSPALAAAFERYKADLPVKVMDKMKREKSAGKKGASKQASETKRRASVTNQTGGAETETKTVEPSAAAVVNSQDATTDPMLAKQDDEPKAASSANQIKSSVKNKPETSAQGNLFGF